MFLFFLAPILAPFALFEFLVSTGFFIAAPIAAST